MAALPSIAESGFILQETLAERSFVQRPPHVLAGHAQSRADLCRPLALLVARLKDCAENAPVSVQWPRGIAKIDLENRCNRWGRQPLFSVQFTARVQWTFRFTFEQKVGIRITHNRAGWDTNAET
jgi:hypothetical protein